MFVVGERSTLAQQLTDLVANSLTRFDHAELYFWGALLTQKIFPSLEASVVNLTRRGSTRVWQLVGYSQSCGPWDGGCTSPLVVRDTCLVLPRWESGFSATAVRIETGWACEERLLCGLPSSCWVRAPLLTSPGMAVSRQSSAILQFLLLAEEAAR